jgi:hypothetical protein
LEEDLSSCQLALGRCLSAAQHSSALINLQ